MSIEERLSRLEKQNRRLRMVVPAALVALVAVMFVGAGADEVPEVIRTRKLEIVDEKGALRGYFGAVQSGGGACQLAVRHPEELNSGVFLTCFNDSHSSIRVSRHDTTKSIDLSVSKRAGTSLSVVDGETTIWSAPK